MYKMWNLEAEQEKTKHLAGYFYYAMAECERWFGKFGDAEIQCQVLTWHRSMTLPLSKTHDNYVILLALCVSDNSTKIELGHEMYHVLTAWRRGLRQRMAVDEMLAILTSRQLLISQDVDLYIRTVEQRSLFGDPAQVNLYTLFKSKFDRRPEPSSHEPFVSLQIADAIVRTGKALVSIAGWSNICAILQAFTFEEWIESIEDSVIRTQIEEVLELDIPTTTAGVCLHNAYTAEQSCAYARALFWLGRHAQAIELLSIDTSDLKDDVNARQLLADLLFHTGNVEEATVMYTSLLADDPENTRVRTDFGMQLLICSKHRGAIKQLTQALGEQPGVPEVQYHLGVAYWRAQQYLRAEECWNAVDGTNNHYLLEGIRLARESSTTTVLPFFSSL